MEPKGSDCYEAFSQMQSCFSKYPTVYNKSGENDDDMDVEREAQMKVEEMLEGTKDDKDSADMASADGGAGASQVERKK